MEIKEYSDIFNWEYDTEDVIYIPNMTQNYVYLDSFLSKGQLVDVIPGQNKRVVFVWKRSKELNELYKIWCSKSKGDNNEKN